MKLVPASVPGLRQLSHAIRRAYLRPRDVLAAFDALACLPTMQPSSFAL